MIFLLNGKGEGKDEITFPQRNRDWFPSQNTIRGLLLEPLRCSTERRRNRAPSLPQDQKSKWTPEINFAGKMGHSFLSCSHMLKFPEMKQKEELCPLVLSAVKKPLVSTGAQEVSQEGGIYACVQLELLSSWLFTALL